MEWNESIDRKCVCARARERERERGGRKQIGNANTLVRATLFSLLLFRNTARGAAAEAAAIATAALQSRSIKSAALPPKSANESFKRSPTCVCAFTLALGGEGRERKGAGARGERDMIQ